MRRRWLETGRLRRYGLTLAFELGLIVTGILLALRVNNWNEARRDRLAETAYLERARADLLADATALESAAERRRTMSEGAVELLASSPPATGAQLRHFNNLVNVVYHWFEIDPHDDTYVELLSSGRLAALRDEEIKAGLVAVAADHAAIAATARHMRREYEHYLYDRSAARRTMFPYADFHGLVAHDTLLFAAQPLEGNLPALRREAAALLRDTATRNGLKLAVFGNHSLRLQCEALARRERALLGLIGADLRE